LQRTKYQVSFPFYNLALPEEDGKRTWNNLGKREILMRNIFNFSHIQYMYVMREA
jgi:hypothetical protein